MIAPEEFGDNLGREELPRIVFDHLSFQYNLVAGEFVYCNSAGQIKE